MKSFTHKLKIEDNPLVPAYMQIKEQIKEIILSQKLAHGTMLPSVTKIAANTGVSSQTVDFGLKELIKDGLLFRLPKKGTFVKGSDFISKKNICLLYYYRDLSTIENHLGEANVYHGLAAQAQKQHVDIVSITHKPKETIAFYNSSSEFDLKGVFSIAMNERENIRKLAEYFPLVKFISLNYDIQDFEDMPPNMYEIVHDDFAGGYQMTQFMINKGHSKFAVISREMTYQGYNHRIAGYRQALLDHGIEFDRKLVFKEPADSPLPQLQVGQKYAELICKLNPQPTAIFCINDNFATGCKEYLASAKLVGQIEVCGYDNLSPELSIHHRFNTMSMNFTAIGERGIKLITNKSKSISKSIKLIPQILLRGE